MAKRVLINFIINRKKKTNTKNEDINRINNLGPSVTGITQLTRSLHIPKPLPPLEKS